MPSPTTRKRRGGYELIGALKIAEAVLLAAAGFGIFRLLNKDLGGMLQAFVIRIHLDPENLYVHQIVGRLSSIDQARLKTIGAGTFFYAVLELVEGVGLILRRKWASYLTIVATGLLLFPEGYELSHKVNALRIIVLIVNLAILVYLIVNLRREREELAS